MKFYCGTLIFTWRNPGVMPNTALRTIITVCTGLILRHGLPTDNTICIGMWHCLCLHLHKIGSNARSWYIVLCILERADSSDMKFITMRIKTTHVLRNMGAYKHSNSMKTIIFWDMTPCSPLSFNRRFGETNRLHLQGRRNTFRKKAESKQVASRIIRRPENRFI
jgi:hypothetical protein